MHLHIRRPSGASIVWLGTVVAATSILGCQELEAWATRQDAQQLMRTGNYAAAASMLLPFPFNVLVPSGVLVAGHIAATVLRTGEKNPPKKKRATTTPNR